MADCSPFDAETERLLDAVRRMKIRRPADVLKIAADALSQLAAALNVRDVPTARREKLLGARRGLLRIRRLMEAHLTAERTSGALGECD